MFASEFMYDNCRVNIGYEHGDKRILESNIQKIIRLYAAPKIVTWSVATLRLVELQLLTRSLIDLQRVGLELTACQLAM